MFLCQKKYATEVLERAGMRNCHSCRTLVDTESKLGVDGTSVSDRIVYKSLAGALRYLTFTKPDLSYAVQQYLSFAKAEYRGVANSGAGTSWLWNLFRDLHSPLHSAIIVYRDNVNPLGRMSAALQMILDAQQAYREDNTRLPCVCSSSPFSFFLLFSYPPFESFTMSLEESDDLNIPDAAPIDPVLEDGALPKFDMHLYKSSLNDSHVRYLVKLYGIPEELHPWVALAGMTMNVLPPGAIGLYAHHFQQGGLQFPFSSFFLKQNRKERPNGGDFQTMLGKGKPKSEIKDPGNRAAKDPGQNPAYQRRAQGTEGVVDLTQWFERMETVFRISNCTVENQVKFATCTLMGIALTWWNSHVRTVTNDGCKAKTMDRT
ncbi:ribonuclease H-like domain-containing protein [Tanacetum coccineum]